MNCNYKSHEWILETHCWVEGSPRRLQTTRYFIKSQNWTKVDNILPRDAYLGDKTMHVLKEKEAHKIQGSSYLGLRRGDGEGQGSGTGEKPNKCVQQHGWSSNSEWQIRSVHLITILHNPQMWIMFNVKDNKEESVTDKSTAVGKTVLFPEYLAWL